MIVSNLLLLEKSLDLLADLLSLALLESIRTNGGSQTHILQSITSRHDVVVVHGLNERLDARTLGDLLLGHGFRNLKGISVNTGENGMGVFALLSALVKVLDNDGFSSGISALQHDNDLSWLQTNVL